MRLSGRPGVETFRGDPTNLACYLNLVRDARQAILKDHVRDWQRQALDRLQGTPGRAGWQKMSKFPWYQAARTEITGEFLSESWRIHAPVNCLIVGAAMLVLRAADGLGTVSLAVGLADYHCRISGFTNDRALAPR